MNVSARTLMAPYVFAPILCSVAENIFFVANLNKLALYLVRRKKGRENKERAVQMVALCDSFSYGYANNIAAYKKRNIPLNL